MMLIIKGTYNNQIHKGRKQNNGCQRLRIAGIGNYCLMSTMF